MCRARQAQVAARFCVSVAFVGKLLRRQRQTGQLAAGLVAVARPAASDAAAQACLRQQPAATLEELRVWVAALGGPAVSLATMGRADGWGWTGAEKKSVHAAERDTERVRALRAAFLGAVQAEGFTCFKFMDETSTNLTYAAATPAPKAGNGPTRPRRPCTAGRT